MTDGSADALPAPAAFPDMRARGYQREAWHSFRDSIHMTRGSLTDDQFASGALGEAVSNLSFRLLLLPSDPEGNALSFTDSFWTTWESANGGIFQSVVAGGRGNTRPTPWGAARYREGRGDLWDHYMAALPNGGMDSGLSRSLACFRTSYSDMEVFRCRALLAFAWACLAIHRVVLDNQAVQGPWEMTVALLHTAGTGLGMVAAGWDERQYGVPLRATHLLRTWDFERFPGEADVGALAFAIGDWLENCWGFRERRFIARDGRLNGQFEWPRPT